MNFQDLKSIEKHQFYLDVAFNRAKKKADELRGVKIKDKLAKSRKIELARMDVVRKYMVNTLNTILRSYPSIDSLPEFYKELIKATLDLALLKKSLGALNWGRLKCDEFYRKYAQKLKRAGSAQDASAHRRSYYGRVSSIFRQIRKELIYLEQARKVMKDYPNVKTSLYTVAICGFPNVGKTTLLSELTGSKPEINAYAFTTKGIMIGNAKKGKLKVQFLDTPGTLNRFEKMNAIEKQAYLAMKYCADVLLYVFDLTEVGGPLKKQVELYHALKKYHKEMMIYISKTDILEKKVVDAFAKRYKGAFVVQKKLLDDILKKAKEAQ